jgi:hypothetical protein
LRNPVKVQDVPTQVFRPKIIEVAINLDLVRDAHVGGGLLHLYFEHSSSAQDDMTFTGENAQKI